MDRFGVDVHCALIRVKGASERMRLGHWLAMWLAQLGRALGVVAGLLCMLCGVALAMTMLGAPLGAALFMLGFALVARRLF